MLKKLRKVAEISRNILEIASQTSNGAHNAASIEEQTASLQEILSSFSVQSEMTEGLQNTVRNFMI